MFYRIVIFCFFCASLAFSDEGKQIPTTTSEQIASSQLDASSLIENIVSPVTGTLFLQHTDLIVKGAQDIILTRKYLSPFVPTSFGKNKEQEEEKLYKHLRDNYQGWSFFPHLRMKVHIFDHHSNVLIITPSGVALNCDVANNSSKMTLLTDSCGMSNVIGDLPSAKNDMRNTRIAIRGNGTYYVVYSPEGTIRYYRSGRKGHEHVFTCMLEKEILPNGKVVKYHYNDQQHLVYVESLDPKERYVYASVRFEGCSENNSVRLVSSSGQESFYKYASKNKHKIIHKKNHVVSKDLLISPRILVSASTPFFRHENLHYNDHFLLCKHVAQNNEFHCSYHSYGTEGHLYYRVDKILLPVGKNNSYVPVYDLQYDPPIPKKKEGKTIVRKKDGSSVVYHYTKNLQPKEIQYFDKGNKLVKEKRYIWQGNGWLSSLEMRDCDNNVVYTKRYQYDSFGNPILEVFSGDICGDGAFHSRTTKRNYHQDGTNRLRREEHESGQITSYKYLWQTDLIAEKIIQDKTHIYIREFYEYDDCYNLVKKIIDDGSSNNKNNLSNVSERKIFRYVLRQKPPFLHMVENIEELCFSEGKEILLKRKHLHYDKKGNVCQEDIFDADNNFVYSIYRTHNERNDVASKTNPIGQKATYGYDSRGRETAYSESTQQTKHHKIYDARNRLVSHKEDGVDGCSHSFSYAYDCYDNVVKKISSCDHAEFFYESIFNKPTRSVYPEINFIEGKKLPVITRSTYNALGLESSFTDANNNTTFFYYTAYGSISKIVFPDSSVERFIYDINNNVISHTNRDGVIITYTYDIFNRVLTKTYFSKDSVKIAEKTFKYNTFHLIEKTDKENNSTTYRYDAAGRKIFEDFAGRQIFYQYDSLGRLASVCENDKKNALWTNFKRDFLDRILEITKTDSAKKILNKVIYTYDKDGNCFSIARSSNNEKVVEKFSYDSLKRLIAHQDALGNMTKISFDDAFVDPNGNGVVKKITTNSQNNISIEIFDRSGNLVRKEKKNPSLAIIAVEEFFYDSCNNLICHKNHIYNGTTFEKMIISKYSYDRCNRLINEIRAFGTIDERVTRYHYAASGKLQNKKLPDNTTLVYEYDSLGYLQNIKSQDNKIDQSFIYNKEGHLIEAKDSVQGTTISREVDPFGNITKEDFGNGLFVEKTYDVFDRPLFVNMSNHAHITYEYDPLNLRRIDRYTPDKQLLYSHSYEKHDLYGNVQSENLINNLGTISYHHDKKGRKVAVSGELFSEECIYDSVDNILKSSQRMTKHTNVLDKTKVNSKKPEKKAVISQDEDENNFSQSNDLMTNLNKMFDHSKKGQKIAKENIFKKKIEDPVTYHLETTTRDTKYQYEYDDLSHLRLEKNNDRSIVYEFNSNKNITRKNESLAQINNIGELVSLGDTFCSYDKNGNLLSKKTPQGAYTFTYDSLNRLTKANNKKESFLFTYDALGRRVSKAVCGLSGKKKQVSYFLYDENIEVGAFLEDKKPLQIRVLENSKSAKSISIEIDGNIFAPLYDIQGNIISLLNSKTKLVEESYDFSVFGEESGSPNYKNPWRYSSMRHDPDLGIIYVGQKYFDPKLVR